MSGLWKRGVAMGFDDRIVCDCADPGLQAAFRAYYGEMNVRIEDWDAFYGEIGAGEDRILVRRDDEGGIVGFLMLAMTEATAWEGFFSVKLGCVEELWVAPAYRGKGHGAALLAQAERILARQGCLCALLTTDRADGFYLRQGYRRAAAVRARNGAAVFCRMLQ